MLQQLGGSTWGGSVYDVDRVVTLLGARRAAGVAFERSPGSAPG